MAAVFVGVISPFHSLTLDRDWEQNKRPSLKEPWDVGLSSLPQSKLGSYLNLFTGTVTCQFLQG